MKKTISLLALLFFAVSAASAADNRRFSVGLSYGITPDLNGLGETITKDGTLDVADGNMMSEVYSSGQVFMGDRVNMLLDHASNSTNTSYKVLDGYKEGGAMLGGELGLVLQYDLDDVVNWPLFVRTGFNYTFKLGGGEKSRTLGDIATKNGDVSNLLQLNGLDPADYTGGTMTETWDSSLIDIPIMLGFRIPIKGRSEVYAAMGMSIMKGGFSIDVNVDEKYANALSTYVDADNLTATNYHEGGAVSETIEFEIGTIGFIWLLGMQAEVSDTVGVFFELSASGGSKTIFNSQLSEKTQKLLTRTQSESLAKADSQWFKRMAFPIVVRGASFRFGAKYYAF